MKVKKEQNSAFESGWPLKDNSLDADLSGVEIIAMERARQVYQKGYTAAHDDDHENGELAKAAIAYAIPNRNAAESVYWWPWSNPSPVVNHNVHNPRGRQSRVRELAKAGALIAAEIDRLRRNPITQDGGGLPSQHVPDHSPASSPESVPESKPSVSSESTPRPWRANIGDRLSDDSHCWVIDSDEGSIAEMMCPADVEQANAELIINAVNSYPESTSESVKALLNRALREGRHGFACDRSRCVCWKADARAALAKENQQ